MKNSSKNEKNLKNHIKKIFNQRSNTPINSSSEFSYIHCRANFGVSH